MPLHTNKPEDPEAYTNNKPSFYLGLLIGSILGASAMYSVCQLYDITRVKSQEHMAPNALEQTIMNSDTENDTPSKADQPFIPRHH